MKRTLTCALVALIMLAPAAVAEGQHPLSATAEGALAQGQIEMARLFALAILKDRPNDPQALSVLAAVGLATQEPEAAKVVASRAFRLTGDDTTRFRAARLAAKASVDLGQDASAKYWLRRAVQVAPDPKSHNATVRDFLTIRQNAPLRLDLDLSIRPSDNVNQGARDALLTIDGQPTWFYFDGTSMALSGVEAALSVGATYRLNETSNHRTEAGLRVYHRAIALSASAKAQAPTARGSDFANSAWDVSLSHSQKLSDRAIVSAGVMAGQTFLSGTHYADRLRFEGSLSVTHSEAQRTRLGASVERQWQAGARPPATAYSVDAGVQRRLSFGDQIAVKFELGTTRSDDLNQENRRIGAQVRYLREKPVAGAQISGTLGLLSRDYPVFFNGIFNDTGREDVTLTGSVDVALPDLGAYGFEPVVSLEASRTRSNVSRYDGQTLGIGLRIQSSF